MTTTAKHGTAIEWTHGTGFRGETWNPVTGCDRVSPGCAHCYALDLAARLKRMGQPGYQRDGDPKTSGPGFGVTLHPDRLDAPAHWRKPRMVFVNSMSDLFHEQVPELFIESVWWQMALASEHTFQVLTKRPERMREVVPRVQERVGRMLGASSWTLPNVWLGVSIENRRFVDRADLLRETPAAVRFVSAEPLLGPLIPNGYVIDGWGGHRTRYPGVHCHWSDPRITAVARPYWPDGHRGSGLDLSGIDWLIVGGESGPKRRPMRLDWARDLRDVAGASGTAFFMKQLGGPRPGGALKDLPDDLRIREMPSHAVTA